MFNSLVMTNDQIMLCSFICLWMHKILFISRWCLPDCVSHLPIFIFFAVNLT
ncbi:hypothetical protein BRADI_1g55535v3 [Brachypodium distachyon]|uniref:Uncharacterized protein n=1 Tax=Brachypodium distachyon TaxID=15368 RepID=A0A0Q3HCH8_BRADI|nr:hypothetical protein BRADI_1g55535v3 [Brachypodium distachyon]